MAKAFNLGQAQYHGQLKELMDSDAEFMAFIEDRLSPYRDCDLGDCNAEE